MTDVDFTRAELLARLAKLSPERRALVEHRLREMSVDATRLVETIPRRRHDGPVVLTPGQELLWALDQAVGGLIAYNVPRVLRVTGDVNVVALQRALDALVERHETLRTRFISTPQGPRQIIGTAFTVPLTRLDLRGEPEEARRDAADREVVRLTREPFDLVSGHFLRAALLTLGAYEYVLLLVTHHIVCDEWSRDVTFRELGQLYAAFDRGAPSPLSPLPIQYADYAEWEHDAIRSGSLAPEIAYWRDQLRGLTPLELPTDRPRGVAPSFEGARLRRVLPRELLDALRTLARAHDASLYMVILAAYSVVLGRHAGQDDVVLGTPISARRLVELEGLIGYFPNALVMRTRLDGDPTFGELVRRTREMSLAAFEHQNVPLEQLALDLRDSGQLGHDPLFNAWFLMQAPSAETLTLGDASAEPLRTDFATAKFDIMLGASEIDEELHLNLEYRTALFDARTIERFGEHLETLLRAAVADPGQRVSSLPLLTAEERDTVLRRWNDTAVTVPAEATLVSLMAQQVHRTPAAVAVQDDHRSLTYAELDSESSALAHRLRAEGVTRGSLVGVCAKRSVSLVVALVAVLKSGGAYVPLDPDYPADRLAFMLEDADVAALLVSREVAESRGAFLSAARHVIVLDDVRWQGRVAPLPPADPGDAAYMIYTSGSTGWPKGALNAHRGIVNRLVWMQREYELTSSDVVIQKTPFSFDVSVWEFFWPLITGAKLVMARPGGHRDTAYLAQTLASGITVCHFVPSMLRAFLADPNAAKCTSLRDVMASGEALAPDLVAQFYATLPGARLHNLYGPTECAVDVSYWACPPSTTAPPVVPIGRPVSNTQLYVLEPSGEPAPIGVPGELFLAGVQVGLGYHRRPELTADRFVADPFVADGRMYKTGDKARWRPDGTVEYLGRLDFQVKVRGFRIELGEIETVLSRHPSVQEAVVATHDDGTGESRLVSYVVPRGDAAGETQDEVVERWTEVFDRTYMHSDETGDAVESGFNIAGWVSSYDKRPIPAREMRDWVDRTVERILDLRPRRVLEIGCGTGLLLFRIAPHVQHYHGLDIAATALESIRNDPAFAPLAGHVSLEVGRADEITRLEPGSLDTIVVNSVVQYFPTADYLVRVLEHAVRLLARGGSIFLGDIRLLPLLETLHTSVALYDAPDDLSISDLRARVQQRMWNETELVVDPAMFEAVRQHLPSITDVQVMIKRGPAVNELTKFRADVVLRVGVAAAQITDARHAATLADVRVLLDGAPGALRVTDLLDVRTALDLRAHELLGRAPGQGTVRELRTGLAASGQDGIDPDALATLDDNYDVTLLWPQSNLPGRFDAVFRRKGEMPLVSRAPGVGVPISRPWSEFVHHAAQQAFTQQEVSRLRSYLAAALPDYMIPSTFVRMDTLPLTPSGKVDRKALRPPVVHQSAHRFVAPRSETERSVAALWAEVLRADRVGADDSFLDLGGHSLLAMRILGRVRRDFGVVIPLETLLRGDTVAEFASAVDAARASAAMPEDEEIPLVAVSRQTLTRPDGAPVR